MNERIKELAEQAGFHVAPYDGINDNDMIKKFAELIVHECAKLTLDYKSDQYYNGWLDYRDEIRKHFGVKE